jgi:predicted nucleic acid-binding protein
MSVECFLDTNVLVYAVSAAPEDAAKRARAATLIASADFGLSVQVLQELYVTVTRKIRVPLDPARAFEMISEYRAFPLVAVDFALLARAVEISLRHRISYWDGAIVAAAEDLDAAILYSEDLSHGQSFGSVRVVNPFAGA